MACHHEWLTALAPHEAVSPEALELHDATVELAVRTQLKNRHMRQAKHP